MTPKTPWTPIGTEHWPLPANVCALQTERGPAGCSNGPWAQFNLGAHCGDEAEAVAANRHFLSQQAGLPAQPLWLNQVHGSRVVQGDELTTNQPIEADAALSRQAGQVLVVLTADCLPVLLCRRDGQAVAAVHAGWRGLAAGIIESALEAMGGEVMAWLGPCIGQTAFEIGPEVREALLQDDSDAEGCFAPGQGDRWQADLAGLARRRLQAVGVACYGGDHCTWSDPTRWYSYRRDATTGRQASLIWIEES